MSNMEELLHGSEDEELSSFEQDDVKDIVEQAFSCGICRDIFRDPVCLMCQHIFCKQCLIKHSEADVRLDYPSCPLCNKRFFFVELKNTNSTLKSAFDAVKPLIYSQEELEDMKEQNNYENLKLSIQNQVRRDLTEEFMRTMPDFEFENHLLRDFHIGGEPIDQEPIGHEPLYNQLTKNPTDDYTTKILFFSSVCIAIGTAVEVYKIFTR